MLVVLLVDRTDAITKLYLICMVLGGFNIILYFIILIYGIKLALKYSKKGHEKSTLIFFELREFAYTCHARAGNQCLRFVGQFRPLSKASYLLIKVHAACFKKKGGSGARQIARSFQKVDFSFDLSKKQFCAICPDFVLKKRNMLNCSCVPRRHTHI